MQVKKSTQLVRRVFRCTLFTGTHGVFTKVEFLYKQWPRIEFLCYYYYYYFVPF